MKFLLSCIICSLTCGSPLFANLQKCFCNGCLPFENFYVSVNGGIAAHKIKHHVNSTVLDPNGIIVLTESGQDSDASCSGLGEIGFGWGKRYSNLYLGGKIAANYTNTGLKQIFVDDEETNINTIHTDLRTAEVTLDFKPGLVCGRGMLFGTLGAAFNCQELKGRSEVIVADVSNIIDFREGKSGSGFRLGGGIEFLLSRCISLQANYVYSDYWRLRANRESEFEVAFVDLLHTIQFSNNICRHTFTLGAAYYF